MALRRLATSYPWNSDVPSCARSAAAWQIASSRGTSDPGFRRMTVSIRSYLLTDKRRAGAACAALDIEHISVYNAVSRGTSRGIGDVGHTSPPVDDASRS